MLIEEWRPEIKVKGIYVDNISPNNKVLFIDEGHHYFHEDDIVGDKLVDFEDSKYRFSSPTGLLGEFYEHFDTIPQAKKYVKKHKLDIDYKQLIYAWEFLGDYASDQGTVLHAYGESLWNGWDMPRPDLIKTEYLEKMTAVLKRKYVLAKTELLVYSTKFRIAGQVDLLVKNSAGDKYTILDYKFLKEPLEMKSFYNRFTRKYKFMSGPFNKLMDTNFYHYSIQLEIYRYLMGRLGTKVISKQLMVVTPEGYELVEAHPVRIWIDEEGILQARYKYWKGRVYDSSKDITYLENPHRII